MERLKGELKAAIARNQQLLKNADQRGKVVPDAARLQEQLNAQITKLRNDLSVQMSHNKVLAQSLDEAQAQLKLQQKKRLGNQAADSSKQ